ncbi:MAG: FTR1 family iron permease [Nitrosopumilaceae archaeon]|jgi:high-affinity iron transporter
MENKKFLVLSLVLLVSFGTFNTAFGDSETAEIRTTIEITSVGLELTKNSLISNDIENAKKYSEFTSSFFGKNFQNLRAMDQSNIDDIHISLLDLHSKIGSSETITEIERIQTLLHEIPYEQNSTDLLMVNLLTVADEQYQIGIQENEESSIQIAKKLIEKAETLIPQNKFDDRLKLEIESFFGDLDKHTENRDDFVTVGNLITVIQKDILGTESVAFNQQELYQSIRDLYDELLLAVDSGDYADAEEKAIVAYLDNFEYLEPAIEKVDEDLLYSLEINMRENLRDMIREEKPPNEIRQYVEEVILQDLGKAESLVSEQFSSNPTLLTNADALNDENLKQMGDSTEEEKSGVRAEVDFIRKSLLDVIVYYEEGDYQSAYTTARTAYLDSYEFVEIPLREISPDFTLEVEYQFAELRNLIDNREDPAKVKEVIININRNLDESERLVSGTGALAPSIAFASSFSIIFREGLESVLILGAILTYLEASRNNQLKKYVYYGVLAALGATAVTWVIAAYIIEISGANRELIEAIAALSATGVLFYVSFWVLNKIEHKKWMEFVKAKVWQATTTGSVMVFVMLAFFTVYREGFETVLFYQAMSGFAKYMEVYVGLGFIIGMVSLLGLYYVMKKLGKKLPLRALFGLTMGVGAYLSIAFLGNAIRELQILDIVSYTGMIGTIPRLDINLATMTGIYPTLETVIAQIILLAVYLIASSYVLIMRPRKEKQLASLRKSRRITDELQK